VRPVPEVPIDELRVKFFKLEAENVVKRLTRGNTHNMQMNTLIKSGSFNLAAHLPLLMPLAEL